MRSLLFAFFTLLTSSAFAEQVSTEFGKLGGADYRIDMPANWNRRLVVYFHGYSIDAVDFPADQPLYRPLQDLTARGYAVIQSGYSRAGWAVEQAIVDSERLRKQFIAKYGKPKRTLAMGMSMGGLLTVHALETQPDVYAGGLALCGALAPTDSLLQRAFAMRAAFDFYFPDVFGALDPVANDYMPTRAVEQRVAAAMAGNPAASASLIALQPGSTIENFPGVVSFVTYVIMEMQQRAGGNPFDNSDLIYVGAADDAALNAGVRRYRGDAKAARYVSRWYTPSGKLERPLLALHTSGDPLVVASIPFDYELLTRRADREQNFAQQYVPIEGHCTMPHEAVARSFDDLIAWLDGKRPDSGLRK